MSPPAIAANPAEATAPRAHVAVRCRTIGPDDFDAVVALLRVGFPERAERYWRLGLQRMAARPSPSGVPRFGYVLDHGGEIVGVLLTIYSEVADGNGCHLRCNPSSWYVDPRFRGYGVILDSFAMADRRVTYLNASPAPHTVPMHEARGFRRHGRGMMLTVPALSRPVRGQRVCRFSEAEDQGLSSHEIALAREHREYGCLALVCIDASGARLAIFVHRTLQLSPDRIPALRIPCWQMIYGPSGPDFAAWSGAIGRHLLRRLAPLVLLDVAGPIAGVKGRYFADRKPRCVRGPNPPEIGDLTATEVAVFGP